MAEGESKAAKIGCVAIFLSPLWAGGLWTLVQAIRTEQIAPAILGVCLFGAGAFPLYLVLISIRQQPQREAFYKDMRAIPAEWKPEWSSGRLQDQTVEAASVINAMTIFLAGISLVFGFLAFVTVRQGAWAGLVLLVVPLILAGFVIAKIRGSMRRKRFGKSELLLDETPAHVGETLRANLIVEKLRPEELAGKTFNFRVSSIRRRTWTERYHGSPTTRSDSTVLWAGSQDVLPVSAVLKEDGLWQPVALEIPKVQQATNDALENDKVYWQLEASASLPGIDYYSQFELPVFVR